MKDKLISTLIICLISTTGIAQIKLHVDGDTDIQGRIVLINSPEDSSLFIGQGAGFHDDGSNNRNLFIGINAGFSNTTGYWNTSIGKDALSLNVNGFSNTAIGEAALKLNISGHQNTALGKNALNSNSIGLSNVGVGHDALKSNKTGHGNTGIGKDALHGNVSGLSNTATGISALFSNTTGHANVAFGVDALLSNQIGNYNTAIGCAAFRDSTDFFNAAGYGFQSQPDGSNQVRIGNNSITDIEGQVNFAATSDGRFKTNIRDNVPGMEFISELRPITFHFDVSKMESFYNRHFNNQFHEYHGKYDIERIEFSGFIAQEVEQAAVKIGYNFSGISKPAHDREGYALRYAEFVVPLVKATQEQQTEIRSLKSEVRDLKSELGSRNAEIDNLHTELDELRSMMEQMIGSQKEESPVILNQAPSLEQNEPNPTNGMTRIGYYLPFGKKGTLVVTTANGQELQRIALESTGKANIDLQTRNLPSGTYNYSLVIEGQIVDTKRMVLQK